MNDDNLDYDSLLENWTLGGSLDGTVNLGEGRRFRTGLHVRRDLMNKKPDTDEPWYSHHHLTASLFSEGTATLRSGPVLTAGLGWHLFATEKSGSPGSYLSPMLGISGGLPFALTASAGWAKAVRFPTMHQLYSSTSGNPDLRPEEADKFEIGVERPFFAGNWQGLVKMSVYHNSLRNLIYRASRTYRYENIESASLPGWEAEMRWQRGEAFSIDISYARIFASGFFPAPITGFTAFLGFTFPSESSRELMEEIPEHRWSARLYYSTSFGLEISYSYNRFGARTTYLESLWLGSYETHDLSLMQTLRQGIKLRLRAANLLDADYQEELGYPAPGRQLFAGFLWTF